MLGWQLAPGTCKSTSSFTMCDYVLTWCPSYALAADIQTIPGLPTAPGYLNVDVDAETGEIDGLF